MLVIDRFEGDFAVIETSSGMINVPKADVPTDAKEGDVLVFIVDRSDTEKRKERIGALMDDLFK